MTPVKPYRSIPIRECGEKLIRLPEGDFAYTNPHPYLAMAAPYGEASPWMLRESIVTSLMMAQAQLSVEKPGWKIMLFDAYRPNRVQAFLVNLEFERLMAENGLSTDTITPIQHSELEKKVYRLFAIPSDDPATPPPHSTGAAFDCTLIDDQGQEVDMGSPIDENSDRSYPDHFANAADVMGKQAHAKRCFLKNLMGAQGFIQNPSEWWHFSKDDQLAIWTVHKLEPGYYARYGRVD